MKFTPNETFKIGRITFEVGDSDKPNVYDSEVQGVQEDELRLAYEQGWCEVEGWNPAPERKAGAVELNPHSVKHEMAADKVSTKPGATDG